MRSRLAPRPSLSYLTYDFGALWGSRLWQGRRANRPNYVIPSFRRRSEPADAAHSARLSAPSAISDSQGGPVIKATRATFREGEAATEGPVAGRAGTSGSSGGVAHLGRLDLTGYRYPTGMGPSRSGDLAGSWVVTHLWLHLYHQLSNYLSLRKEGPHSRRGRPLLSVRFELWGCGA